jgi:HK97 family phage major capsid protein
LIDARLFLCLREIKSMDRLTVLPFLLMFMVGLGAMAALPIYQICRRGVGTLRIDAHRVKPSAWASAFLRRVSARWRQYFAMLWPIAAAIGIALVVAHFSDHSHIGNVLAAATPLNTLRQLSADNAAAQARVKEEGRRLLAVDRAVRTPEQVARLDAIDVELGALSEAAVGITKDLAREERFAEAARAGAVPADTLHAGANLAAEKPVSFGEFLQGVAYSQAPAFASTAGYQMPEAVKAALYAGPSGASAGVSADGGVLVRSEYSTKLLEKAQEASQLLAKCDDFPIGAGNDAIEAPYINETSRATGSRWGGVQVYRRAEADTVSASKPTLALFELRLEDIMGVAYATERLLRDAPLLQAIFEKAFSSEFAFRIDDEIIRGTGAGQCLGILNADAKVKQTKEVGQQAATIKAENIIKMFSRMRPRNLGKAEWFVNTETLPQLMTMSVAVGTGGQLVYMPPGGLSNAPYGTLLGRPVNPLEQCSALGTEGDIIFSDFGEYATIAKDLAAADSMHVRFLYNERTFRWVYPINGKPKMASPITPYKGANTLSAFVTLENR